MTAPSSLGRNTAVMAVGTVLSRITGFGRVLALAYVLGFERLTDTYNLANTTPNIIFELVLGGVLSATLVPVFVNSIENTDDEEGWTGISALVSLTGVAAVAISVVFAIAAPWIIRLYTIGNTTATVADQQQVATALLRLFAPQVALYGLITVAAALLHARRRFGAPMFTPVLNNVVVIVVILLLPRGLGLTEIQARPGLLWLLGLGTTAGVAVQAIALFVSARRADTHVRFVWQPRHPTVQKVMRLSGWTMGFVIANQLALYVVLVLANRQRGGVSAYQAAQTFFMLPHAIFAVSIVSALLPEMSALWSRQDLDRFRDSLSQGIRLTAAVMTPAAVGYLLLAHPIVTVVLDHGAMRADDAATTANVLAAFAAGLPGFSAFILISRAFMAMTDTKTVFWLYVLENAINGVFAVLLFPSTGVVGLAGTYSAAYAVAALVGIFILNRRLGGLDQGRINTTLVKVVTASAVMALAVFVVRVVLGPRVPHLVEVGAGVVAGVSVYLAMAQILKLSELSMVFRLRRRAG